MDHQFEELLEFIDSEGEKDCIMYLYVCRLLVLTHVYYLKIVFSKYRIGR